mmetsp:Transcript_35945/g.49894  ORF Transcript_35945/g.49894 Transcript_35945/m.49894 type:complete len:548 (+) Transcript_35945:100-1743(+)|eukprot:CAMPEP_0196590100 /NCGR_PEP_ID=MMETSP1081-20130531/65559_1 /TAXON_ID=36882 /ORGANISM="Pyramimonas amylifera, Strain CCMP720" /LENGTH=547 /DNA_ID=CAMNT_0041913095 /DNA_START=88 /DNA_END=1731 /DNA_ORIENTATION=+
MSAVMHSALYVQVLDATVASASASCTTSYRSIPGGYCLRKRQNGFYGKVFTSRSFRSTESQVNVNRKLRITASKEGELAKTDKPPPLIFKARWINKSAPTNLETVQLIKVQFKLKYKGSFGEGVRVVGGHEALGNWSLADSTQLTWTAGDIWVTPCLELPVDGIFVYKYVLCQDGDASQPLQWQTGNNQVLALAATDAPLLEVHDNWKGDPSMAFTCNPDGSNSIQAEQRLLGRVRAADQKLHEAQSTIADLSGRLKRARYEAKALREEAKIGASARLALKSQLAAERSRANNLETQVLKWKEEEARAQIRLQEAVNRVKSEALLLSSASEASPVELSATSTALKNQSPPPLGNNLSDSREAVFETSASSVMPKSSTGAPTRSLNPRPLNPPPPNPQAPKPQPPSTPRMQSLTAALEAQKMKEAQAKQAKAMSSASEMTRPSTQTKNEKDVEVVDAIAVQPLKVAKPVASMPPPPPPPPPPPLSPTTPPQSKETPVSEIKKPDAKAPEKSSTQTAKDVVEQMGKFFGQQARSYQKPNPARWWMKNKR